MRKARKMEKTNELFDRNSGSTSFIPIKYSNITYTITPRDENLIIEIPKLEIIQRQS